MYSFLRLNTLDNYEGNVTTKAYELRCRECGKSYGNQPLSICDDCFSPLEVDFDLDYARGRFTREAIQSGPLNMWRYQALLPVPDSYIPTTPAGMTPLMAAPRLGARIGADQSLSQERRRLPAHAQLQGPRGRRRPGQRQEFGFDTVGCSSTGNLANAVAAGAARLGLKTYILVPADLEPAKILNTQVYGANLIRIDGNYDHCNRLCSQIAESTTGASST
jgi:threonine synthase